jgi:hypothetical protein
MGACDSLTSSTKLYSRFLASDADKVVIFYFLLFVPYMVRQHRVVVKSIFSANGLAQRAAARVNGMLYQHMYFS